MGIGDFDGVVKDEGFAFCEEVKGGIGARGEVPSEVVGGTEIRLDGGIGDREHGLEIGVAEWIGAIKGGCGVDQDGVHKSGNGIGEIEINKGEGAVSGEEGIGFGDCSAVAVWGQEGEGRSVVGAGDGD